MARLVSYAYFRSILAVVTIAAPELASLIRLQRADTAGHRSDQEHAADYQRGGRAH